MAEAQQLKVTETRASSDTRARILEQALKIFAERGFDGASIRDIGQAAAVNFQLIPYHFGNKEQLWEAVVVSEFEQLRSSTRVFELALEDLPPVEKFKARIRVIVGIVVQHRDFHCLLMREAMKNSKRFRHVQRKYLNKLEMTTTEFLEEAMQAGVIKSNLDLEALRHIYHGALLQRVIAPAFNETSSGKAIADPEVSGAHAETLIRLFVPDA